MSTGEASKNKTGTNTVGNNSAVIAGITAASKKKSTSISSTKSGSGSTMGSGASAGTGMFVDPNEQAGALPVSGAPVKTVDGDGRTITQGDIYGQPGQSQDANTAAEFKKMVAEQTAFETPESIRTNDSAANTGAESFTAISDMAKKKRRAFGFTKANLTGAFGLSDNATTTGKKTLLGQG